MRTSWDDTIAAVATPQGRGGVGVIRVSGPTVESLLIPLLGKAPKPREATFCGFRDASGQALDQGIALYFPAPRSFTGESTLELHAHGNPVLLDLILARLFELGCRPARAGEFSERAFLNNKMDLAQAEAVADLINAETAQGVRAASRSLEGEFSREIHALVEACIGLRQYVEAAIDFTDEDIDFLSASGVREQVRDLLDRLDRILVLSKQGALLREGMTLVLAGKPNAGKSSLLNCLSGRDAAIVTEIAGTTRDTLREHIELDGIPLHIIDTAGLRLETSDVVEEEGIRRARAAFEKADLILIVVDDRHPEDLEELLSGLPEDIERVIIRNKIDLTGNEEGTFDQGAGHEIRLSLRTGQGVEALKQLLIGLIRQEPFAEGLYMARRRHIEAIEAARDEALMAEAELKNGGSELVAEHLRVVQAQLSTITGAFSSDDLLGRIFSSFCIGK